MTSVGLYARSSDRQREASIFVLSFNTYGSAKAAVAAPTNVCSTWQARRLRGYRNTFS